MSTRPPTRRQDRGRNHFYFMDGDPCDGVTWALNSIAKPALIAWAANATADYATDHWEELAELKSSERNNVLRRSRYAEVNKAAKRGTEVHDYAQRYLAGEEIEPPEELVGHVDSYIAFANEWEPRELLVEQTVGSRLYRYMGTPDLVAGLADGRVWLLDVKTGGKGIYPEFALQLAAYRYAEFYLDANNNEVPMPKVDCAGCIWARADGYDLVPVDTDYDTFGVFLHALQVARFTKDAELVVGDALPPPGRTAAA